MIATPIRWVPRQELRSLECRMYWTLVWIDEQRPRVNKCSRWSSWPTESTLWWKCLWNIKLCTDSSRTFSSLTSARSLQSKWQSSFQVGHHQCAESCFEVDWDLEQMRSKLRQTRTKFQWSKLARFMTIKDECQQSDSGCCFWEQNKQSVFTLDWEELHLTWYLD